MKPKDVVIPMEPLGAPAELFPKTAEAFFSMIPKGCRILNFFFRYTIVTPVFIVPAG